MTHNLKAFALALATASAFAAMATAATAAEHHLTGTKGDAATVVSNNTQVFTATTGGTEGQSCKSISVTGTLQSETNTSVTAVPSYSECETHNGITATVDVMQCHYTLQGLTTSGNPTGGEHANFEIKCDTGGSSAGLTVKVSGFACVTVPPQTINHALRYENVEGGKVKIIVTAHGIESKTEGVCKNKEGVGENQIHNNGSYTGEVVVDTAHGVSVTTT